MKLLKTELWDEHVPNAYWRISAQVSRQVRQQVYWPVYRQVREHLKGEIK